MQRILNHPVTAILAPALIGLLGCWFAVRAVESYGLGLFLGLPLLVSFLSSLFYSYKRQKPYGVCYGIAMCSIAALGGMVLLFALDGLICLLMALPLAALLALLGALVGGKLGAAYRPVSSASVSLMLCLLFPTLVSFEKSNNPEPKVRTVTTSVEVDAAITEVWKTVIEFPKIESPPTGIFRVGIAYPIEARIEGKGVGAIRYCTFSTGDFVEPITTWDEPHLLQFDVTENPHPMEEWSPYGDIHAAHLHGYMVSERGRFLLAERDGKVFLEGTTWYSHSIAPEFYWGLISDAIIHRIHSRVLEHIKLNAESGHNE